MPLLLVDSIFVCEWCHSILHQGSQRLHEIHRCVFNWDEILLVDAPYCLVLPFGLQKSGCKLLCFSYICWALLQSFFLRVQLNQSRLHYDARLWSFWRIHPQAMDTHWVLFFGNSPELLVSWVQVAKVLIDASNHIAVAIEQIRDDWVLGSTGYAHLHHNSIGFVQHCSHSHWNAGRIWQNRHYNHRHENQTECMDHDRVQVSGTFQSLLVLPSHIFWKNVVYA